jgi:hypothetical protein
MVMVAAWTLVVAAANSTGAARAVNASWTQEERSVGRSVMKMSPVNKTDSTSGVLKRSGA